MDGSLTFCWYDLERQGNDFSTPPPVTFAWEDDEKDVAAPYYLLISEKPDMTGAWLYITEEPFHDVYNLKVDTEYYWCVQKNGKRSCVGSFKTELTLPRTIDLNGISNVRDLGGYKVKGGRIRQGLVFRGGEFELHMSLSKKGAEELTRLGIRTELDMRGEAIGKVDFATAEALNVKRILIPCAPYTELFRNENRNMVKSFFKVFATAKNYPIYFHCWGGADRTGTFAFILGAFLGMELDDLIYEYEFTSLSVWGIRSRNYKEFINFLESLNAMPGETLQEKAEAYLKDFAGMTDKQLKTIYDVLVEKTVC